MKENLDGLVRQAGAVLRRGDEMYGGMYAFSLEELAKNLRELRDRHRAGDVKVVEEFFAIYVFEENNQPKPGI